jgi:TonB family protein
MQESTMTTPGSGYLLGHASHGLPRVSRRTLTFLLVACLHAAVFYGLLIGATTFTKLIPTPLVARAINLPRHEVLPPLPGPQMTTTTIQIPRTIDEFRIEPGPEGAAAVTAVDSVGAGSPPSVPHLVNRLQGGPGVGFPSTNDFYPSISIYREEEGAATIEACVDATGRLTSEPKIIESARSSRLDDAALRLAKAGSGHYRATTEDGQPVNSCYAFRVRFSLRK